MAGSEHIVSRHGACGLAYHRILKSFEMNPANPCFMAACILGSWCNRWYRNYLGSYMMLSGIFEFMKPSYSGQIQQDGFLQQVQARVSYWKVIWCKVHALNVCVFDYAHVWPALHRFHGLSNLDKMTWQGESSGNVICLKVVVCVEHCHIYRAVEPRF